MSASSDVRSAAPNSPSARNMLPPFWKVKRRTAPNAFLDVSLHICAVDSFLTVELAEARVARSARALRIGKLRPAIVLYDEPHPLGDDIGSIETVDLSRKPDLLIIMGTSLKVHGLKKLVKEFAKSVHATGAKSKARSPLIPKGKVIFVNKTAPSSEWDGIIDYHIEGETDAWVERVLDDWKRARPADWEVQTTLDSESTEHPAAFKAQKSTAQTTRGKGGSISLIYRRSWLNPLHYR